MQDAGANNGGDAAAVVAAGVPRVPEAARNAIVVELAPPWTLATRVGAAASILVHAALIGILVAKFGWGGPITPAATTIPVDLVPDPAVKPPREPPKPLPPSQPKPDVVPQQKPPPSAIPAAAPPVAPPPPPSAATTIVDAGSDGSDLDAVRAQVQACWTIPPGWKNPNEVSVTIGFRLNPDGSVAGRPAVIEFPATLTGKAAAENGIRAVLKCGPYQPTAGKNGRDVEIRLSPP